MSRSTRSSPPPRSPPRCYGVSCCMQRFRSASDRSSERHGPTLADRHRTRAPHRDLPPGRTAPDLRRRTSERQKSRRDESGRPGAGAATRSRPLAAVGRDAELATQLDARTSSCSGSATASCRGAPRRHRHHLRRASRRSPDRGRAQPLGDPRRPVRRREPSTRPANPPTALRLLAPRGRARLPALSLPSVIRNDFVPAGDSRAHILRYWRVSVPGKRIGTSGVVATGSVGFAGRKHISARSSAG